MTEASDPLDRLEETLAGIYKKESERMLENAGRIPIWRDGRVCWKYKDGRIEAAKPSTPLGMDFM